MHAIEQTMEIACAQEVHPISYNWDFLSSNQLDNTSIDVLDLFFEAPPDSSALDVIQQHSDIAPTHFADTYFPHTVENETTSARSSVSYSSSEESDHIGLAEGTTSNTAEQSSNALPEDDNLTNRRHIKRRDQNRKAQSNFRQKRKQEVRSLEREVHELRAQLEDFHKRGPVANLSICTQCRTFFPANEDETALSNTLLFS